MSEQTLPLSDIEHLMVAQLLKKRRAIADRFALIMGLVTFFVLAQIFLPNPGKHLFALIGVALATVGAVGALLYYTGYRPVLDLKKDLEGGKKLHVKGKVTRIESQGNAYGESITTIWLTGDRFLTRSKDFDTCREGAVITLYVLPISRFAIGGEVHQS